MINIIACVSKNGVIGNDNSIIWDLPPDMKRFKELTTNNNVIMGRKTFESIGRLLPNRKNIIISNNRDYTIQGGYTFNSLWSALDYCNNDCFIIGGSQIYEMCIEIGHKIYLTTIHKEYQGDSYFPKIRDSWKIVNQIDDEFNNLKYSFIDYERRKR